MLVFTIINQLKDRLLKEESFRPYRQPPFNAGDWERPYTQDVPPFLGGGKDNRKAVPQPPVVAPQQMGGNLEAPDRAQQVPPTTAPSFSPKGPKTKPQSVVQFLSLYIAGFNRALADVSSGNPITKFQVKDEFTDFLKTQVEAIDIDDADKDKRFEALKALQAKFNEIYEGYNEETSGHEEGAKVDAYPDLAENQIHALFDANRKTKGSSKAAIAYMETMPEIRSNDNNYALFQKLRPELESKLVRSSLSEADRSQLYKTFMDSYLNDRKATTPEDRKKVVRRFQLLLDQKEASESLSGRKKKRPVVDEYEAPPVNDDPPVDPFSFLQEELFQADIKNKDLFLSFFLEKDMLDTTSHILGESLMPEDVSALQSGGGKYQSNSMNILQNHAEVLKDALIGFMTDKSSPMNERFFNWVLNEIRRFGKRKNPPNVMQESDPNADGLGSGSDLSVRPDRAFSTDFRLPIPQEVFKEEGLRNEGPPVAKGSDVDMSTLESLNTNWKKIDGFIGDVLAKMGQAYAAIPNNAPGAKDTKMNLLEKSIFWSRMQRSCRDSVSHVIEYAHRTGKNLTDERSISILNQDWDTLFKQEHWRDFGWNLEDSEDIRTATDTAVRDGLAPSAMDAYQTLLGKIDFKGNAGAFSKDNPNSSRDNTANALSQKAKGKLTSLKEYILDPDIVAKYGGDTLISFLDIIGFDKYSATIGSLLSKNNRGSFEDKVNYLTELSRRGVIQTPEAEIEHMSAKDIAGIFEGVRDTLQLIYSPKSELRKALGDPNIPKITDAYVAQLAAAAGIPSIKTKADFAKAKNADKTSLVEQFYSTEYGKYYIEEFRPVEALKEFLNKHITQTSGNPDFLRQHGFNNRNEFLASIGVTDPSNISNSIDSMPQRRFSQIAQKFYPKLYAAYRNGVLQKTLATKDKGNIQSIVDELLQKPPAEKALWDKPPLAEALFFADALDSKDEGLALAASSKFNLLRKIAMQKRANQLLLLKQRLIKLNVDTSILEDVMAKIEYGRS